MQFFFNIKIYICIDDFRLVWVESSFEQTPQAYHRLMRTCRSMLFFAICSSNHDTSGVPAYIRHYQSLLLQTVKILQCIRQSGLFFEKLFLFTQSEILHLIYEILEYKGRFSLSSLSMRGVTFLMNLSSFFMVY